MSAEITITDYPERDHKDSFFYMMMRRIINEQYAQDPLDFNEAGLKAGELLLQRELTAADIVVDLGSSSGEMIAAAAIATGTRARILCVEPDETAHSTHVLLPEELQQRVSFVGGAGEKLPLRNSSVQGVTLHNVIFRARNARTMLSEIKRVVEPGGYIAISSNAEGHAFYRHEFERQVAEEVTSRGNVTFSIPTPPAEGHYLENLPSLIQKIGGLKIIDELYVEQKTHAVITRGARLETYLDSIKYSAANTDLPDQYRSMWRKVVNETIRPLIESAIDDMDHTLDSQNDTTEPFFADTISRGMFVIQNKKTRF